MWALTCTGVVIDPDVARVADAHEGAGCVHTHCVLAAVVFPLGALVDIWTEGRSAEKGEMKGLSHSAWRRPKPLRQAGFVSSRFGSFSGRLLGLVAETVKKKKKV